MVRGESLSHKKKLLKLHAFAKKKGEKKELQSQNRVERSGQKIQNHLGWPQGKKIGEAMPRTKKKKKPETQRRAPLRTKR